MPEYWVFFDWAPLYKQGYSAVFNLLYLSTLKCMVEICKIAGKDKTLYQEKYESVEKSIIRHFWSEKYKVFYDGYDIHTKRSIKTISQHAHSLAILLDLKRSIIEDSVKTFLFHQCENHHCQTVKLSKRLLISIFM